MQFSLETFTQLFPGTPGSILETFYPFLVEECDRNGINTDRRLAAFLANVGEESRGFQRLTENGNYSPQGLLKTFPKYFKTLDDANTCAHKPSAIFNRVYANRMGNGGPETGDGSKYSGRGLIQLTGRDNYRTCGQAIGVDLEATPDLLVQPQYACASASWFWVTRELNKVADVDFKRACVKVNGGLLGYDPERLAIYNRAMTLLSISVPVS